MGNKKPRGPQLPDPLLYVMAGIDPKTMRPIRADDPSSVSRETLRRSLRIIDEQDAVNRYRWYNLPSGITGQDLERMLYYKYTVCIFYVPSMKKFYITPFAFCGSLDFYGRYNTVHPVPMSYGEDKKKDDEVKKDALYDLLSSFRLEVVRDLVPDRDGMEAIEYSDEETKAGIIKGRCVILNDYTPQTNPNMSEMRFTLQEPYINLEADIVQYLRTAMLSSTGVKGVRVHDADESVSVMSASKTVESAARAGHPFVPIITKLDVQELGSKSITSFQDYLMALQSIDNMRLSTYGLENGGLFQKKAHKLQDEQDMNAGPVALVNQDGLALRQRWANIANSLFGLSIWVEPNDAISQGREDYEEPDEKAQEGPQDQGGESDADISNA